jgi:3-isopropylmalate/(R)-2-methylmalate dehydratase large subunit
MASPSSTLFEKIWSTHVVEDFSDGRAIIHVDRHVIQESSCRVSFEGLRKLNLPVRDRNLTFGVIDHAVATMPGRTADSFPPTRYRIVAMRENCRDFGIKLFDIDDPNQGIEHVVAPELGITLPGCTLVCSDSHTPTNGALGAWAWGVGTTEARHVLANQCLIMRKPKTMRVDFTGTLQPYVFAKDLILHLVGRYGVTGGVGSTVEYAGPVIRALPMEARMTICNMSIEFGARSGMIAVDDTTIDYVAGRPYAPKGAQWEKATATWRGLRSDDEAEFDKELEVDCTNVVPQVTWGTSPQDVTGIDGRVPELSTIDDKERRASAERSLFYLDLKPGQPLDGVPIDIAFIGSCTNARLSDLEAAASVIRGRKVAPGVRALVVPGSTAVKRSAEAAGLDKIFRDAGFEWRESGCSMCVGSNGDSVTAGQRCVSTSNRNYENRQGRGARTHLASPATVAAAAVTGHLTDVRKLAQGSL